MRTNFELYSSIEKMLLDKYGKYYSSISEFMHDADILINEYNSIMLGVMKDKMSKEEYVCRRIIGSPIMSIGIHLIFNDDIVEYPPIPKEDTTVNKRIGYVYMLKADKYVKIGRSSNPETRIQKDISPKLPFKINKCLYYKVCDMYEVEAMLHKMFKNRRKNGEWFEMTNAEYLKCNSVLEKLEYKT